MNPESCVLIVDRAVETREVLRTALGRRRVRVLEAGRAAEGLRLARECHPHLIVLDVDDLDDQMAEEFSRLAQNDGGTLVMLGAAGRAAATTGAELVAKPYHFEPVIHRIEELLRTRRGSAAA